MTADRLTQNLNALRPLDPLLAEAVLAASIPSGAVVETARNGAPTLVWDGQSFHSRFDPLAEARKLVADALAKRAPSDQDVLVFGLGLGYHVLELSEKCGRFLVFEPEAGLIRLALATLDFRAALPNIRFLAHAADLPDPERTLTLAHPPSVRRRRELYEAWRGGTSPRFAMKRTETFETAGRLRALWRDMEGASEVLAGFPEAARCSADDLSRSVLSSGGDLTETEIYLLLIRELQGDP